MKIVSDKHRGTKAYFLVFSELINAARYRGFITYQDVAAIMGLPSQGSHMGAQVGSLIGAISEDEHINGRPMLSAIIVNVGGSPGEGFYGLARELGKLQENSKEAKQEFWEAERAAVYATWQKGKPK